MPAAGRDRPRPGGARRHAGRACTPGTAPAGGSWSSWTSRCRPPLTLPGASLAGVGVADGRLVTFSLDGSAPPPASWWPRWPAPVPLRDISVTEPEIEDVIARLYTAASAPRPPA